MTVSDSSEQPFQDYVGRQDRSHDRLARPSLEGMAALLDKSWPEASPDGSMPPLWHWMFFAPWAPQSAIGPDGHPARGGFMPPVELPRRMFAGARLRFLAPLFADEQVERLATITSVSRKSGGSGDLVFVTVRYEYAGPRGPAIVEEQDIVYLGMGKPQKAEAREEKPQAPRAPEVPGDAWTMDVDPDPVRLFRFSALTRNGHRIHYDRRYAMETEGYPGLVVHGPYQAILLTDLLARHVPAAWMSEFSFRGRHPLFDTAPFRCVGQRDGREVELSTRNASGLVCLQARATLDA